MKKNTAIKFCFVLSLLFLITNYSLLITILHAVTVDLYQDCESGNDNDVLTPAIMNASSHGTGTWSISAGTMYVSTNRVRRLPGTVTAGGITYTDTGTRTWKVNDNKCSNFVKVNIDTAYGAYNQVLLGCYLTPGPTVYVYNNFDTIVISVLYYASLQIINPDGGGPYIRCHSCDVNWVTTVSPNIKVVAGKTYWVNLYYDGLGQKVYAAVFDPDNSFAQVGDTVSCMSANGGWYGIQVQMGRVDNHGDNPEATTQTYFDNMLLKYTNPIFPLLPDISSSTDTTPPGAPGAVRDGATAGTDISSTMSRTQLSANWTAPADAESEINGYQYAIGTTAGGTNTANWTALGNVLTVTKTGLTFTIGTTYYFSVKAVNGAGLTGGATNSNGQVVISTAVADTTPPSVPGTVRDGATAGADISSTTSRTQLSANWTASADAESGISEYQYAIGTTAGGTSITNWTALGNVLTVAKTGLSLTIGTTYYFSVKGVNGQGLAGNATNSNGQVVLSTAVADTTPPGAPGTVRDGATVGTDDSFTYSTTALSANWTNSSDTESGIVNYQYAIGTTAGGTNVTNWTALGNVLTVTKTGLTLTAGTTYYFSVKAVNGAGLSGPTGNSNGQYVKVINTTDTTPPSNISEVKDGTGESDVDLTTLTTELSANWDSSADVESGISRYYFAIGSSPGATDITNWTDNGILTNVTKAGLSLTVGTTHYFSVKAQNGVGLQSPVTNSNGQVVLENIGATAPVITNVQTGNISQAGVTITWDTGEASTSQVEYGLTAIYGNLTTEDSSLVTAHSVNITGLVSGRTYHYRVISKNSNGRMGTSADFTFATLSTPNEVIDIRAYPNPHDFSNGAPMKFKVRGTDGGEVKIFTITGKPVRQMSAASGTTEINWDGRNGAGEQVSRGVYISKITDGNGNTITTKIAVIR